MPSATICFDYIKKIISEHFTWGSIKCGAQTQPSELMFFSIYQTTKTLKSENIAFLTKVKDQES